jgi:hypothetical protein
MGKLISFVVFVAAFAWTWFLFNSQPKVNMGVHAGLQSKLALLIEDTIKTNKPQSYDFKMLSLYTQTIDENKVSAHFSYKYSERTAEDRETSHQTITGEAILNRSPSENPNDEKWVIQSVKSDSSNIEFQEGLVIGASETAAAGAPTTAPAAPASGDATPAQPTEEPKTTN